MWRYDPNGGLLGVKADAKSVDQFGQQLQEMPIIRIVSENRTTLNAARGDVIPEAGTNDAQWSGHLTHGIEILSRRQLLNVAL
jgi:hypothetical protein